MAINVRADSETAFQKQLQELMSSGFTLLGLALGHDLGLIRAMGEIDQPVTARELANKVDCKERYVQEWLLHMTMANLLEMDTTSTSFSLPEGALDRMKMLAQSAGWIPALAASHEHLVRAFKTSGPKAKGAEILDIGCHVGNFCLTTAARFPKSTFYGVDVSEPGVLEARKQAESKGIRNVTFQVEDAARLPNEWSEKFEAVFLFNVLHDIPLASKACAEIKRVLKPGGQCVVRDMNIPSDPWEQKKRSEEALELYTFSLFHCLPGSMNAENSEALGTCCGRERITSMMETAGLKQVATTEMQLPESSAHVLVFVT